MNEENQDLFKFKPGEKFKLTPKARVTWLATVNLNRSCVRAIRTDCAIGKAICAWLDNNKSGPLPFSNKDLYIASNEFWPHHLEKAVKL